MQASQGVASAIPASPLHLGEFLMSGLLVLEFLCEDFLDSSGNSFLHVKTQKNTLISLALVRNPY